jgi:hypothetical protein
MAARLACAGRRLCFYHIDPASVWEMPAIGVRFFEPDLWRLWLSPQTGSDG